MPCQAVHPLNRWVLCSIDHARGTRHRAKLDQGDVAFDETPELTWPWGPDDDMRRTQASASNFEHGASGGVVRKDART